MLISFKAETAKAGDLHPEVGRSESANENAHRARLGGNTEVDGEGGVAWWRADHTAQPKGAVAPPVSLILFGQKCPVLGHLDGSVG